MIQAGISRGLNDEGTPWVSGKSRSRSMSGPVDLTDDSPHGDSSSRRTSSSSSATSLTVQHVMPTIDVHQRAVDTIGEQIATVKELLSVTEDEEEKATYRAKLSELLKRKLSRLDDIYSGTVPDAGGTSSSESH